MGRNDAFKELTPPRSEADERVARRTRISATVDQPLGHEAVHTDRDRAGGQPEFIHEAPLAHATAVIDAGERDEHTEARRGQAVCGEDAVELGVDVRTNPGQAGHHSHWAEVEI